MYFFSDFDLVGETKGQLRHGKNFKLLFTLKGQDSIKTSLAEKVSKTLHSPHALLIFFFHISKFARFLDENVSSPTF